MARMIGAVPVFRAMDVAKSAPGTIYLEDPSATVKVLRGIGTDFMSPPFTEGCSIYLPTINGDSQKLDIGQIIGPDRLILKNSNLHPDALFQLTDNYRDTRSAALVGTKFKIAPRVDQTELYKAVFDRLAVDGCIGIFPEGGSHDRTQLLPLKGKSQPTAQRSLLTYSSRYCNHGPWSSRPEYQSHHRSCWSDILPCAQIPLTGCD